MALARRSVVAVVPIPNPPSIAAIPVIKKSSPSSTTWRLRSAGGPTVRRPMGGRLRWALATVNDEDLPNKTRPLEV